jgi:exopolyphosphatase/guanosine-5'-triphosphate,3'-diphosphate pyrophosphatase
MAELRSSDLAAIREQLGREPTTRFSVVARCPGPHPLVIRNHPLDAENKPFPTLYWLTCPDAVKGVSKLEAEGWIDRLEERFAGVLPSVHSAYAEDRARNLPEARDWGGVGGTRRGLKCLHAHYANHVAGGDDPVGAWVAERIEPVHGQSERVAAIDLGTNSIRLIVLERSDGDPTELARDMVITRIGKGVDRTGRIEPDSLARTVAVLERYCRRARALHASRIRVGATSAVRDASNREELEDAVRENAGTGLEVITGEREAWLSFLGATRGLDAPRPYLVLDIGGGSTEFVVGEKEPRTAISTQMGSVRLTERFVSNDPPTAHERRAIRAEIDRVLDGVREAVPVSDAGTLVAVAGTSTTVRAIDLDLAFYDPDAIHRSRLSRRSAETVLERLASMTTPERAALPVMASGRADVIVAGATILVEVMARFGFDDVLVSETDILDGLAFELLEGSLP